jgi:NADPH:quinone reductase-like Zn-dependent oxidoreductase
MSVVNPLTALAFLELAQQGGHTALVQTAAASALGQMVIRLCQRAGITVINIVRRAAQVAMLQEQGAAVVLDSSAADFQAQLAEACRQHQPRLAFDAVGGLLTLQLLEAMPRRSQVTVYGGLALQPIQASPAAFIFRDQSINGFWLTRWLSRKNPLQSLRIWQRAQKLMLSDLRCDIRQQFPLAQVQPAILAYQAQMTGGKVLLTT